jgi:hypothetical protein
MHGIYNIKFVNSQKAKLVYHYKNIKEKLHKTNVSIWYNTIYMYNRKINSKIHSSHSKWKRSKCICWDKIMN